jgi:Family of unknown function (DUF5677)
MTKIEELIKEKYGNIKSVADLDEALGNPDFFKEYSDELLIIIKLTIDPSIDNTYVYEVNSATVAGLFTKMYKYYLLLLKAHEDGNYETVALISRPLYEAFVIMKYLILKGENSQKHYRLISYRRRYKQMQEFQKSGGVGLVMLEKLRNAMEIDSFQLQDFEEEDKKKSGRKWELDGKNFSEIHKEVEDSRTYAYVYGMISEVVHSGWGDIRQMHLFWNEKKLAMPKTEFYQNKDFRIVVPISAIMIDATEKFLIWHERESEMIFINEHKRINNLLTMLILKNYEDNPEKYIKD